jgi:hypothetical protein
MPVGTDPAFGRDLFVVDLNGPEASEGEANDFTITNYHFSALFVLLGHVLYKDCRHGRFDFRLASMAWAGTERDLAGEWPS